MDALETLLSSAIEDGESIDFEYNEPLAMVGQYKMKRVRFCVYNNVAFEATPREVLEGVAWAIVMRRRSVVVTRVFVAVLVVMLVVAFVVALCWPAISDTLTQL